MPEGAGVVSALIMDIGQPTWKAHSVDLCWIVIVFIVGSMNTEESRPMERTVGREAAGEPV